MNGYSTETEQVEMIKKWWQEYGAAVIAGIFIAIIVGFGWRFWQERHEMQLQHASLRYEQLLTNIVNGNTAAAEYQANRLMDRYPHTPYAELASLQIARQEVNQGDLAAADHNLGWIMRRGDTNALRQVARLRLARVLLAENKADAAFSLVGHVDDKSYVPAIDEVRGDILAAQGKTVLARQAYQDAVKALPGLDVMQPLLQMKIDDLAGAQ